VCETENPARAQWYKTVLACKIDDDNRVKEKKDDSNKIVARTTGGATSDAYRHGGRDKKQERGRQKGGDKVVSMSVTFFPKKEVSRLTELFRKLM